MFFVKTIREILTRQEVSRTAEVQFLRTRITALEDCILDMKREGFQRPPVVQQIQRELLSDTVMSAIDSVAGEGTTLHNEMLEYARTLLLTEMPDEMVADRIIQGGSHEDWD